MNSELNLYFTQNNTLCIHHIYSDDFPSDRKALENGVNLRSCISFNAFHVLKCPTFPMKEVRNYTKWL